MLGTTTSTSSQRRRGIGKPTASVLASALALVGLAACGDTNDEAGAGGDQTAANAEESSCEGYPEQPVNFVIPYGPGGSTDPLGRAVADAFEREVGASMVVQNVPGAAGTVGTQQVLTSEPDGHTFGLTTAPALLVAPGQNPDLQYQDFDDWATPAVLGEIKYFLYVKGDSRWETAEELFEEARSGADAITIGSSGGGNVSDFLTDALDDGTDDGFRPVPFSGGGGEAFAAVLGGQTDAVIGAPSTGVGAVESGDVRALAVFAEKGAELGGSDVPPITDFDFDLTTGNSYVLVAPAGIPEETYDCMVQGLEAALVDNDEFLTLMENGGITPVLLFGEEATERLMEESEQYEGLPGAK
jgi:tripartite-type tricarboxylate transporter receptor subunit TctC